MKYLRAVKRFLFAPEFELFWSGLFLSQFLYLFKTFPDNPNGWQIANLCITFVIFVFSSYGAYKYYRQGRRA